MAGEPTPGIIEKRKNERRINRFWDVLLYPPIVYYEVMSEKGIDFSYVGKKLEFLARRLELLEEYRNTSFGDFRDKPKDEKYVEKVKKD